MRRPSRQKTSGSEWDWTDHTRRMREGIGMTRRPGLGKLIKRALARRRRRMPIGRED